MIFCGQNLKAEKLEPEKSENEIINTWYYTEAKLLTDNEDLQLAIAYKMAYENIDYNLKLYKNQYTILENDFNLLKKENRKVKTKIIVLTVLGAVLGVTAGITTGFLVVGELRK